MSFSKIIKRLGLRGWSRELWLAAGALLIGFGLMPVLIFFTGASLLGRYEGASLRHLYGSIYGGLEAGSVASWIVLLGPYGLYLLSKALKVWWRASAKLA
jgi:hypothetical protein